MHAIRELKVDISDYCYGLKNHNKYEKLSIIQIKYVKDILLSTNVRIKEFQAKCNLSKSTLNRINMASLV